MEPNEMYDINIARETCYHISIGSAKLSNEVEEETEHYTTCNNEFKYSNNFLSNFYRCGISCLIFVPNSNDLFIYLFFTLARHPWVVFDSRLDT